MPRKHLIANKTNKKQQNQAKLWQKLAREISAAVRVGGPNIEANPRLRAAVDKALQNNLSRDSINKNINGVNKDASKLETVEYECYGPNGMQIIISALTDNTNRTSSSIRGYLGKINASISKPNSVKNFFSLLGQIIIFKTTNISEESLLEDILDFNIENIVENEDSFEIYCLPNDFYNVKDLLTSKKHKIFENEIKYIPFEKIQINDDVFRSKFLMFLDNSENDEDIQWVVTNVDE